MKQIVVVLPEADWRHVLSAIQVRLDYKIPVSEVGDFLRSNLTRIKTDIERRIEEEKT